MVQPEQPQPQPQPQPPSDYSELTEDFSDVFETHVNPWSAAITFGYRATKADEPNRYKIRIRMPLQQAKTLAVILLRNIRDYEEQTGTDIDLPQQILDALGIAPEDWRRFAGG